ncbi:hypothetical protein BKA70DRAFT_48691 [Coprinopsis sp. MPI-PUGE-AT-0042]|nr:hypothetical protein BKA70DRAFT_48691 [Coprinopsis sp. MPI-PUGE-AT-0042]
MDKTSTLPVGFTGCSPTICPRKLGTSHRPIRIPIAIIYARDSFRYPLALHIIWSLSEMKLYLILYSIFFLLRALEPFRFTFLYAPIPTPLTLVVPNTFSLSCVLPESFATGLSHPILPSPSSSSFSENSRLSLPRRRKDTLAHTLRSASTAF